MTHATTSTASPVVDNLPLQALVDTTYSEAPACNAEVRRIAENVLPCMQRVKPELADRLQALVDQYRQKPRLKIDSEDRKEVINQIESNCLDYWNAVLHQLDSKAPEGECLLAE
ncbi:hypothetical protein [Dokdonella sp.]|uniref:hypothetical protein n=1 Tax=Dokdonella sp. TaxID=2291710 RepID=UPI003529144E